MQEIILIIAIILLIWGLYVFVKHTLKNKTETITAYTGGLGSGKTFHSVNTALKLYRKNLTKYRLAKFKHKVLNWFRKLFKKPRKAWLYDEPLLFSNIPIVVKTKGHGKKKVKYYCNELTKEHLLLQEQLPLGSVVMLDEIGSFASQFDYNQKNVIDVFDEFVRFFRHYVSNPQLKIQSYMVVNDQCSENINLVIRRRLNVINNLSNFYLLFGFLCFWYERKINISEEIKTIDLKQDESEADTQDNANFKFMFYFGGKRYDSYCYHGRYLRVKYGALKKYTCLSKDDLLKCPRDKVKLYTPLTEIIEKKEVK